MKGKRKIIRAATVPTSLETFLDGALGALMERYDLVLLSSPGAELDRMGERHGARTVAVAMERHMAPLKDVVALLRLIIVFAKERPRMVHSMTPKAGLLCMLAAWIVRVPLRVHTFTGLVWPTATGLTRRILMLTDWLTCACATRVVPEGCGVMHDLQQHITHKQMRVLGYGNVRGVDMKHWSRRPEVETAAAAKRVAGVFTFVFVGRIVGDKGINELVEAFMALRNRHKNVRLVLVGRAEAQLDPVSDATRDAIGASQAIEAVGEHGGDDLVSWYAAADCFVFPSYREGFPNTVLEAGAMGLPSIVTDINGSREIVADGKNGLVIPPHDSASLLAAMERMVTDDTVRERMAANARPMIECRFEQGAVLRNLLAFYDEIGV